MPKQTLSLFFFYKAPLRQINSCQHFAATMLSPPSSQASLDSAFRNFDTIYSLYTPLGYARRGQLPNVARAVVGHFQINHRAQAS